MGERDVQIATKQGMKDGEVLTHVSPDGRIAIKDDKGKLILNGNISELEKRVLE